MSQDFEEARYRAVLAVPIGSTVAVETLSQALYDESWRVRRAAAERLPSVADRPAAVRALLVVLADRDQTGARNAAAEALSRLGAEAVPALLGLLTHEDPDQRKFAADILGEIRALPAAEGLVGALADPDPNVRVSAAEALGRVGGPVARRALQDCLSSTDVLMRMAVLEALLVLRSPPPLPVLAAFVDEPRLRRGAYRLLGLVPDVGACEVVCRGLASDARAEREAAFMALASLERSAQGALRGELEAVVDSALRREPRALALVGQALAAEDEAVRRGALWAARILRDPKLAPAVAEVAQDERVFDEVVQTLERLGSGGARAVFAQLASFSGSARAAAAEALVRVADPPLVPLLVELATSGEADVRVAALRGLGKAQSLEALEPLVLLLSDPDHEAAAARALTQLAASYRADVAERLERTVAARASPAAVLALAQVAGAAAVPLLRKTSRDPDARVRAASVEATGELGGGEALELVRLALVDEAPAVRAAAARALGLLRAPGSAKLLHALFTDADVGVRACAAEAVGQAGFAELSADLERAAAAAEPVWAAAAVRALGRMGRLTAACLAQAARHPDSEVVKEALRAGVSLAQAVPIAREHLTDARWDVRVAAARTLAASGGAESLDGVREALHREEDPIAREALQDAAERLARR